MKRFLSILAVLGALAGIPSHAADLAGVRSVYVMPMAHGMDQFLANRLIASGAVKVVVDPKLADAIFTDKLGAALTDKLEDIAPLVPPATPEKAKDSDSDKDQTAQARLGNPAANSALGRAKGTLFLVDAKTRQIVWSTFELPKNNQAEQLNKTATDIADRLKKDLKR